MRILLLAPGEASAGSGAAAYNHRMVEALRAAGHAAELVGLRGRYPAVAADAADLACLGALPDGAHVVLDGIALGAWTAVPQAAAALIHQPSALFGADGAGRTELEAVQRAALAGLKRLIATSDEVAWRLSQQFGVASERISVVPPGVDDVPRNRPGGGPCHLLSLGPLVARREHEVLLAALERLADLDWRLTLVGSARRDPAHAAALREAIARPPFAGRVTLKDDLGAEDLGAALWSDADLFVLAHPVPSLDGAVMQALRRGIPTVLCAAAAPPTANGALLSPPRDVEQLSKVLRRMIFDGGLRARMAETAWTKSRSLPGWGSRAAEFAAVFAARACPAA